MLIPQMFIAALLGITVVAAFEPTPRPILKASRLSAGLTATLVSPWSML